MIMTIVMGWIVQGLHVCQCRDVLAEAIPELRCMITHLSYLIETRASAPKSRAPAAISIASQR